MRIPRQPPEFKSISREVEHALELEQLGMLRDPSLPYPHWDDLRHRTPPRGLSHEAWWFGHALGRRLAEQPLPLLDTTGRPFRFVLDGAVLERLHRIDFNTAGRLQLPTALSHESSRQLYLISSLQEEAITSSQLEGAATTRLVAKDMLRTNRAPRTEGEQMILNNYLGMQFLGERRKQRLSPDMILELHRILTDHTLPDGDQGRFRLSDERVVVEDRDDGEILHVPPPADQLPARLEALCAFANDSIPGRFVHPVLRAILVHFWLAYDHPFVDGNGRTARALFYWSMLREGYWLTEYLSISSVIKRASNRYLRAFLHVETDANDTTYFLLHQLEVIEDAFVALHEYLERKSAESESLARALPAHLNLNHRQIALLTHALREPDTGYTTESHRASHGVALQTARTDLLALAKLGLLEQRKRGRTFVFYPAKDLAERLRRPRR